MSTQPYMGTIIHTSMEGGGHQPDLDASWLQGKSRDVRKGRARREDRRLVLKKAGLNVHSTHSTPNLVGAVVASKGNLSQIALKAM
jgi:hypothetical protein